ncbi:MULTISPECIES: N-acetylneuraminate lyase [unclassified Ligilactobacillus]|uniref:N-acetylneuraminate lyase n=1 Tax=unclassified Ligilactobacillus TaxID=2767920 RepID=UPI00385457CC
MQKVYSALMTAFDKNGNLDEQGTREIIRYNIDKMHVDGLYVGGSTGEAFLIDEEEKKKIFKIAIEEAAGACDLIAQVGSPNLVQAKRLANYVVNTLGYSTISAVTPFYYHFDFDEIKNYYDTIVEGLDTRLIVYSIPALTGVALSLKQFEELLANPKIVGIKYTNNDFYLLERLRNKFPDKKIYSGFDEMLLSALVLGVDGCIGSTFNVNTPRVKREIKAFNEGDIITAREMQRQSNDLISAILDNDLYNCIKLLLQEQGVHAGFTREPMRKPTAEMKRKAHEIAVKYLK